MENKPFFTKISAITTCLYFFSKYCKARANFVLGRSACKLSVENPTAKFITGCKQTVACPLSIPKSRKLLQYVLTYCIAMVSKKRVVLDLNAKLKVIQGSDKDKLIVKQIVGKF
jgi:hypothetical protein